MPTLKPDRRRLVLVELRLPHRPVHRPVGVPRRHRLSGRGGHADRRGRQRQVVVRGVPSPVWYMVEIDHGNGLVTRYAHASKLSSRKATSSCADNAIAAVGSTGRSTGPHLHFEVRFNGAPQNPARFLQASRLTVRDAKRDARQRGVRRSSPLAFCGRAGATMRRSSLPRQPVLSSRDDQHPHPHLRQPQRAAAQAVRAAGRARSTRSSRRSQRCPTTSCAAKTAEFKQRVANGETLDDAAARGLRRRARGRQAHAADAPLRRAADRRHGAAQRQDRRDAHRRRQDAGRDAAGLPERARRQGRPRRHGQRLPRAARRRLDGPALPLPRPHRRRQPVADGARRQAGRVRRRHHLRHQQRVRLRLPARQHGVRRRASACSAA